MDVVCPQCNATYRIPDHRLPAQKAVLTCKRCNYRIPVHPLASGIKAAGDAASSQAQSGKGISGTPRQAIANEILETYPPIASYDARKYRFDQIIKPNKRGKFKTNLNKLKIKLLEVTQPIVDRLLDGDEHVVGVAAGLGYYPLELIFGNGLLTMLYNRFVLVATNRRLVAVNTNYRLTKPTHYLFQFPYAEMKKVSKGLFGTSLTLTRKYGKKRIFTGINRSLAGEMKSWLSDQINPEQVVVPATCLQDNLCPACLTALPIKLTACPRCRVPFKTPKNASLRSLLLPGWGDMYLGHRVLGCFELLGALIIWCFAMSLILQDQLEGAAIGVMLLLFFNGMDALLTLHMAKKGYILAKKQPERNIQKNTAATASAA